MQILSPRSMSHRFVLPVLLLGIFCFAAAAFAFGPGQLPATTERDPALPRITLNGYPFHAEAFGTPGKPVLIVLHGGPGADYRYLLGLRALADDYQVVFYDQRGTGLSPRVPAGTISLDSFIADLDAFVDAFGRGRPVHLVGHSWGAMLASAYTGRHPARVASLVLAEPGFLDAQTQDVFAAGGLPSLPVLWGFTRAWVGQWFVPTQGDPFARDDWFLMQVLPLFQGPDQRCDGPQAPLEAWRFGHANFEATVGRMMREPDYARSLDLRRGVDAFTGPTLFLAGSCNQRIGEAHQRRMLGHFRHGRLAVVHGAGHYLFNDQPERSLALVRDFLASGR